MAQTTASRRALEEFTLGEQAVFSRTFGEADVAQFIGVTWDVNPFHTDAEFCKGQRVGRRIVPGLLVGSMLTHIGGLAAVLASGISFEFLAPVYIGDTVTAVCTVAEADAASGVARIDVECTNQDGRTVLRGHVRGRPTRLRR